MLSRNLWCCGVTPAVLLAFMTIAPNAIATEAANLALSNPSSSETVLRDEMQTPALPPASTSDESVSSDPSSIESSLASTSLIGESTASTTPQPVSSSQSIPQSTSSVEWTSPEISQPLSLEEDLAQVTSVSQLSDVQPTDWAFQALQSLVERYGCIAGYPDGTYRGNRSLTRYEFAAGLNACLDRVNELIAAGLADAVTGDDIVTLQRLQTEFAAELAALRGRVDALEARTAELEANQFSTTTQLSGEAIFAIAGAFGDRDIDDNQIVFQNRVRLDFVTSFIGSDALSVRLESGNADTFNDLDQGELTYNFLNTDNDVVLGWLAYTFTAGDFSFYVAPALPFWQDFVPVVSPYFDDFTGGSGALTAFGESSPIYKVGLATDAGLGFTYQPTDWIAITAGYFSDTSSNPAPGNGLFNGAYAALGQITITPVDQLQIALTYSNAYFNDLGAGGFIYDFSVGTATTENPVGNDEAITNSYGVALSYEFSSRFAVNVFGLYTDVQEIGGATEAEIWSYGLGLAFPDFLSEGSLAGLIVGAEPYVGGVDDTAFHVEGFYKYQLNDNISITPGIIWIAAPSGESDDDAVIGVVRTTFRF